MKSIFEGIPHAPKKHNHLKYSKEHKSKKKCNRFFQRLTKHVQNQYKSMYKNTFCGHIDLHNMFPKPKAQHFGPTIFFNKVSDHIG